MLWLAGLMGLAGVGAASFVGLKSSEIEEEDEVLEAEEIHADGATDMLQEIHTQSDAAGGLLASGTEFVEPEAAPASTTTDGWGDDILNEVMAEFDTAEGPAAPEPGTTNVQPLILQDPIPDELEEENAFDLSLSDWITERSGAEILDYSAETESLMLVWDDTDAGTIEPDVDVAPDPDDPEVMQVSMNGENVAEVYGDAEMSVADLTLIPLSSAIIIGLAPAVANFRTQSRAV
ncbi:hypothetical protein [uncultured Roseobacter sp.]|uniref:hypothetical protein n=1 Tax=uncultured Roseobacter sp. TaxID=114847 RepID=UPI00261F0D4D|nr:hypothetical protein [uncultured Roseobacter sp.]